MISEDIMPLVLGHLDVTNLGCAASVCSKWQRAATDRLASWRCLEPESVWFDGDGLPLDTMQLPNSTQPPNWTLPPNSIPPVSRQPPTMPPSQPRLYVGTAEYTMLTNLASEMQKTREEMGAGLASLSQQISMQQNHINAGLCEVVDV